MESAVGNIGLIGGLTLAVMAFIRIFLMRQITDLRQDVDMLRTKLSRIEALYDEQRSMKHKAYNDVARAVMALDLVRRLAVECQCGVLSPLQQVIDRLLEELETTPNRRVTDPPASPPVL